MCIVCVANKLMRHLLLDHSSLVVDERLRVVRTRSYKNRPKSSSPGVHVQSLLFASPAGGKLHGAHEQAFISRRNALLVGARRTLVLRQVHHIMHVPV